ncbi:hypothetical protein V8G54_006490 [Vigna mungo]|uniref:Uncharacterized protein n=1 Tax=Vigna mungo TaxID=3915 RepID=A0AAQ3P0K8_VIGMU
MKGHLAHGSSLNLALIPLDKIHPDWKSDFRGWKPLVSSSQPYRSLTGQDRFGGRKVAFGEEEADVACSVVITTQTASHSRKEVALENTSIGWTFEFKKWLDISADFLIIPLVIGPMVLGLLVSGVLEFIAEEGMIYMPYWMMENMLLQEGDIVKVKNVTLPKATYVKLQPHTKDFLDISNPKAILETTLRNFSCLTIGDSIMVAYNNKKYYLDIIETKPDNAISIIETNCKADFALPLDSKEPEKPIAPYSTGKAPAAAEDTPAETEPKFKPFSGTGRRLDGKPSKYQPPPVSSSSRSKDKKPDVPNVNSQSSTTSSSQSNAHQSQGKLVFRSNANRSKETGKAKEPKPEPPKENEESKFQAFTGKKYSIRG